MKMKILSTRNNAQGDEFVQKFINNDDVSVKISTKNGRNLIIIVDKQKGEDLLHSFQF